MWTDSVGTGQLKEVRTELAFKRSWILAWLCTPGGKATGSTVGCPAQDAVSGGNRRIFGGVRMLTEYRKLGPNCGEL